MLTKLIDLLRGGSLGANLGELSNLFGRIGKERDVWGKDEFARARVLTMTALDLYRDRFASLVRNDAGIKSVIKDVEGRWKTILHILAEKNIYVLPGGTLERYLPCFAGDRLEPKPDGKRKAIDAELQELQRIEEFGEDELLARYGELYTIVKALPSAEPPDLDRVLRSYLSDYVHQLQKVAYGNPSWGREQLEGHMSDDPLAKSGVVSLKSFLRSETGRFTAVVEVSDMVGEGLRVLEVFSDTTIGNMSALHPP